MVASSRKNRETEKTISLFLQRKRFLRLKSIVHTKTPPRVTQGELVYSFGPVVCENVLLCKKGGGDELEVVHGGGGLMYRP